MTVRLRRALVRLLWLHTIDGASCTCEPGDRCPLCEATMALGMGRWKANIRTKLAKIELERIAR